MPWIADIQLYNLYVAAASVRITLIGLKSPLSKSDTQKCQPAFSRLARLHQQATGMLRVSATAGGTSHVPPTKFFQTKTFPTTVLNLMKRKMCMRLLFTRGCFCIPDMRRLCAPTTNMNSSVQRGWCSHDASSTLTALSFLAPPSRQDWRGHRFLNNFPVIVCSS